MMHGQKNIKLISRCMQEKKLVFKTNEMHNV